MVKDVRAGTSHTCARFSGGGVKCWGANAFGQLGLGNTTDRGTLPAQMGQALPYVALGGLSALAITAGEAHTCSILSDGNVKCWGRNFYGQLGLGDTDTHGDQSGEMGADLPIVALDALGVEVKASAISAGTAHTCALVTPTKVKCWGNNTFGQLGQGDTKHRGDEPNEMGDKLLPIALDLPFGVVVNDLSAGATHTCVLLSDGTIRCWGNNDEGQLGLGDRFARGDEPYEMGEYLPTIDLGLAQGTTVHDISAGAAHTCALLSNGNVKCWGKNDFGQLGLGDQDARGDEPNEMGQSLPTVDLGPGMTATSIHAGHSHTCALLSSGRVKCWGRNLYGQLGLSDTIPRGDEPSDMGDRLPVVEL